MSNYLINIEYLQLIMKRLSIILFKSILNHVKVMFMIMYAIDLLSQGTYFVLYFLWTFQFIFKFISSLRLQDNSEKQNFLTKTFYINLILCREVKDKTTLYLILNYTFQTILWLEAML